jgi:hypothetical protein
MNQGKDLADFALDLLSRCISDFYKLTDEGQYEESDLSQAVKRLQKVIDLAVPADGRDPYLKAIASALVVPHAQQVLDRQLGFGPSLSARGKRLAHVAEGLRDDLHVRNIKSAISEKSVPMRQRTATGGNTVFVVRGRDRPMQLEVCNVLTKLGLQPIVPF